MEELPKAMQELATYRSHSTEERVPHAYPDDIRCLGAPQSKGTKRSSAGAGCLRFENIPCQGIYARVK